MFTVRGVKSPCRYHSSLVFLTMLKYRGTQKKQIADIAMI